LAQPRRDSADQQQKMKLLFDHGTLVLAEAPDLSRKQIPGVLWDPRVELYRAPGYRYAEVVEGLRSLGLPFIDAVRAKPTKVAYPWRVSEPISKRQSWRGSCLKSAG
jgi:hypothetical protein